MSVPSCSATLGLVKRAETGKFVHCYATVTNHRWLIIILTEYVHPYYVSGYTSNYTYYTRITNCQASTVHHCIIVDHKNQKSKPQYLHRNGLSPGVGYLREVLLLAMRSWFDSVDYTTSKMVWRWVWCAMGKHYDQRNPLSRTSHYTAHSLWASI
jgi:hypothetical protein